RSRDGARADRRAQVTLPPAPSAIRSSPALAWARAAGRELPWLAALALAALLVHLPTLLTGDYAYEADTVVQYWPLTRWLGARLAEGGLPLWIPGIFGGYPILADGELGELYPPNLLALLLLAPGMALVVMRVVHTALAAFNAAILA